jgi:trimeric autotransporter adhesin
VTGVPPFHVDIVIKASENTAAAAAAEVAEDKSAQQLDEWFSEGEAAFHEKFAQTFSAAATATAAGADGSCDSTDSAAAAAAAAAAGDAATVTTTAAAVAVPAVTPYAVTERDHTAAKAALSNLLGSIGYFSGKNIIKGASSDAITSSSSSSSSDAHAESFATRCVVLPKIAL